MMSLADDVIGTIHADPIEGFRLIRHFLERSVKNCPAFGGIGGFGPSDSKRHRRRQMDKSGSVARYFGRSGGAFGAGLPDELEAASHSQACAKRERSFEKLPRLNDASDGASWLSYIRTKSLPPSASARMKGMGAGESAR
jgi:hypothetical protein